MEKNSRIYVAGHRGLVGSAIIRRLQKDGYANVATRTRQQLDLIDQRAVTSFFDQERPEYIFLAAAKVGGMRANMQFPADFLYENLMIQNNVITNAVRYNAKRLIYFNSNCAYPRLCSQPMMEEYILGGPLEPTNESYAIAKIAGMNLCQSYNRQLGKDFITLIPASIYGPNDHFGKDDAHIIPQLFDLLYSAKKENKPAVKIAVNPNKIREFLFIDDLVDACLLIMQIPIDDDVRKRGGFVLNVGTGKSVSIRDLSLLIKKVVQFDGVVEWDDKEPIGMPEKVLSAQKINTLGWKPATSLENGLKETYQWYLRYNAK
ncbi:MAG: GDP-L-fucose synthase [Candidatus Taylorbacteria bacterium]|nr:GDP-L-fucose synthase [Candidatus Taylorbacteria bacterium]